MVNAKSVLYSCAIGQKPFSMSMGHLVVTNAVPIIMSKGIDAILVSKPGNMNKLQIISKLAVKFAQKAGS